MRINSLYKGILAILNALLLLEVVPQASESVPDSQKAWLIFLVS